MSHNRTVKMDREGRLFGRKPVTTRIRARLSQNATRSHFGTVEKDSLVHYVVVGRRDESIFPVFM